MCLPMRPGLRVYVCALPSSGNRLLQRLITAAGGVCQIHHGYSLHDAPRQPLETDVRCVLIARSHPARLASVAHHGDHKYGEPGDTERIQNLLRGIVALGAPVRVVSYEGLVADPERVKDDLLAWLGLPLIPWPEPVVDANAKWLD
jgi:hypothetical protein